MIVNAISRAAPNSLVGSMFTLCTGNAHNGDFGFRLGEGDVIVMPGRSICLA